MRFRKSGSVAAFIAGLAVSAPAAPASSGVAGIGVRLLPERGASIPDALARSYIVGLVAPGVVIRRRIEVGNSTGRAMSLAVYPGAAGIQQGSFTFAAGRRRNDLARWTKISSQLVHLLPGAKTAVTVTVRVPTTAASGERYAVVWAESSAAPVGGVRLTNRVGIRLYLTVGGGGTSPGNFAIGALRATRSSTGAPLIASTIRNVGRRTLLLSGDVALSHGPGGSSAGPFPATLVGALSPGGTRELRVRLDHGVPRGPWSVRLHLHSGPLERSRTTMVRFPYPPPVASPAGRPATPLRQDLLIFAILVSFLAAASVFTIVAFRASSVHRRRSVGYSEASGTP